VWLAYTKPIFPRINLFYLILVTYLLFLTSCTKFGFSSTIRCLSSLKDGRVDSFADNFTMVPYYISTISKIHLCTADPQANVGSGLASASEPLGVVNKRGRKLPNVRRIYIRQNLFKLVVKAEERRKDSLYTLMEPFVYN
jgi:hypothetical protein